MKCPVCQDNFPGRRATCPTCQILLLPVQGETISELEAEVPENEQPRSGLMTILRVMGLVIALIGLATVVRLNYVSGGRERDVKSKAGTKAATTPAVAVFTENQAREKVVVGKPEEASARSVDREKEKLSDKKSNLLSARIERVAEPSRSAPKDEADRKAPATRPENKNMKTASLSQVPDSVASSVTSAVTIPPKAEPPAVGSAPEAEAGTEISLEPLDKTLSVNTGLVTLNSYTRARIYIDGQFSGMTPRTIKLLSGEHTITLMADGYEEWTKKIRLNGRQQAGLMASMNRKASE